MPSILGIKISDLDKIELEKKINSFLIGNKSCFLVTPNPEMILAAQQDEELFQILNKADLAPADGFGLLLASLLQGKKINRFSGSDLSPEILKLAEEKGYKVFIANWKDGLSSASEIESVLKINYPKLEVLILDLGRDKNLSENDFSIINNFAPQIMFCTFGSASQEKFVYHNYQKIKSLKLSLPIGGSFDFITKKLTRSPLLFRRLGLEWFWRLVQQPQRFKRIFNATFVFSYKIMINLFKKKGEVKVEKGNEGNELRLRFAPSPTGFLHIGNLRTALFGYLIAKNKKGKFILRIEDTDKKREVEGAVEKLIDILSWVGINFDEGPGIGGNYGPYIQTERLEIYKKYYEQLLDEGKAYRCFCSEERLEEMRNQQTLAKLAPRYDRACRDLDPKESLKRAQAGEKFVIRQKLPLTGELKVYDELRGEIIFKAEDLDDQVLIKSNGIPTYQFANIVDDHLMEITHVTRGDEWLSSFPKNILLYQAFNWIAPKFIHLPLLLNKTGGKLSKRQGDVFVEDFREKGYLPEAIINFSALLGWHPKDDKEILSLEEIIEAFSIDSIGSSPAVFDVEKLDYYNAYYLRQKSVAEIIKLAQPYLKQANLPSEAELLTKAVSLAQDRLKKLSDLPELISYIFQKPECEENLIIWKNISLEEAKNNLGEVFNFMLSLDNWEKDNLETKVITWIKENKEGKNGDYLWPLRTALSGLKNSPGPFEIAWALGREESSKRIKNILNVL